MGRKSKRWSLSGRSLARKFAEEGIRPQGQQRQMVHGSQQPGRNQESGSLSGWAAQPSGPW